MLRGAASFDCWLGANAAHRTWFSGRDRFQNAENERPEIGHAVGLCQHQYHRHPDRPEVLLVGQVAVHGDKDVKLASSPSEQFAVQQATPPMLGYGTDIVVWQLCGEIRG